MESANAIMEPSDAVRAEVCLKKYKVEGVKRGDDVFDCEYCAHRTTKNCPVYRD